MHSAGTTKFEIVEQSTEGTVKPAQRDGAPSASEADVLAPVRVEERIERALGGVVPPDKLPKATEQVLAVVAKEFFQGPLPPPEQFSQYDHVLPGAADRILQMAESEQAHRIFWEQTAIRAETRSSFLGLCFGFLALVVLVSAAVACAYLGKDALAGALIGATTLGLIPAFIKGRGLFNWFDSAKQQPEAPPPQKRKPQQNRRTKKTSR
ncbi:DUF2335 domain-containing protein [Azospirillum thermophilum]|uniref:DUF2335 domain-containing protein n=1 Tax=Azospirillum thermophilum TaxID=2202148 RepID=A0A2S2CKL2_9PROT|nr:hypothetical protein DEW08_01625 [Azospirillum thermophilum]